jgi:hypothetical protein
MTTDEVWIGNWIYGTLTFINTINDSLTELHTPKITVTTTHRNSSVFTSRCLVSFSNGWRTSSSGLPNCLEPQLPASNFSKLQLSSDSTNHWTTSVLYSPSANRKEKRANSVFRSNAFILSLVYTAVTWQWVYMSQYSRNRPWKLIGLWDVEAQAFFRQSVHRWRLLNPGP